MLSSSPHMFNVARITGRSWRSIMPAERGGAYAFRPVLHFGGDLNVNFAMTDLGCPAPIATAT